MYALPIVPSTDSCASYRDTTGAVSIRASGKYFLVTLSCQNLVDSDGWPGCWLWPVTKWSGAKAAIRRHQHLRVIGDSRGESHA